MNTGVLFQMLGGSATNTKTVGTQVGRATNDSNTFFKKEMDKAFDRKQSATNSEDKSNKELKESTATKSSKVNRVQKKAELKSHPTNKVNSEEKDTDVTKEMQELAAPQIQQPVETTMDVAITEDTLHLLQSGARENTLVGMFSEKMKSNLHVELSNAVEASDGEIKMPFQNNADLVKLAMIKSIKGESQENGMQDLTESLKKGNQMQGGNVQEIVTDQGKNVKLQNSNADNDNLILEQGDMPEQNVLVKTNNLDLSKLNIKVADAPVDTTRSDMAKQLADKITYKFNTGKQEFDLELNPRNLGKVNVKMIFQDGSAQIIMSTSNSKAHQLLSMHVDALRGILENNMGIDSTINLKNTETSEGQFDRDNFQEQSNGQQNQQKQHEEKKATGDISFIDRLRLGLVEELEEAV